MLHCFRFCQASTLERVEALREVVAQQVPMLISVEKKGSKRVITETGKRLAREIESRDMQPPFATASSTHVAPIPLRPEELALKAAAAQRLSSEEMVEKERLKALGPDTGKLLNTWMECNV